MLISLNEMNLLNQTPEVNIVLFLSQIITYCGYCLCGSSATVGHNTSLLKDYLEISLLNNYSSCYLRSLIDQAKTSIAETIV